ncbi:MAG TPA: glutamate-cysteine ligase family protein [Gemmatimonadaceae bacterium]|nr:glutamate-cysteine ligase family protein [Gemmatimonadaceae bacterium]
MSLTKEQLLDDVRRRLFAPTTSVSPRAIGLELELIPLHRGTDKRALITEPAGGTAMVLSELGRRLGWSEQPANGDAASWNLADGSCISFEPGGQIEFSTSPCDKASEAIEVAAGLVNRVREAMAASDIDLIAAGVDPWNSIDGVPLQRHRDRYVGMTRFFDSIGPSGVQMMRQTAALQLNVERGPKPIERWRLLNALAPVAIALFANSRAYAGSSTGYQSYRAQLWRTLDPTRTGIVGKGDEPVGDYYDFALNALAMRSGDGQGRYLSFADWMTRDGVDNDEWLFHLSTLFPEVRAKEYFELRSADTIDVKWLAAPVAFVTGIVYDEEAARAAMKILPYPDGELLECAGRLGVTDSKLRGLAQSLCEISLSGATRLGEDYLSTRHIEVARRFFGKVLQ